MRHERCELWGFPGAGKSTVARKLALEFEIKVPELEPVGRGPAAWARRRLCQLAEPAFWPAYTPPDMPFKRRLRSLSLVRYRQSLTLERCAGPFVLEEGVLHEIWRLLYCHPDQLARTWWHKFVSTGDTTVVLLDLPPELARERISTKPAPGPINRELLECPGGERWDRAVTAYEVMLKVLLDSGTRHMLRIDVTRYDSRRICAEVVRFLEADAPAAAD